MTLSTEGTTDWAHWGLTTASSFNHKSGITAQISNYSALGGGTAARYDTNPNGYSWTDGTPTASAMNSPTGLYINGLNKGFQITVPADTTSRTVKVYVGVWGAQGKLEATLSDSSASAYADTSVTDPGGSSDGIARVYTLTYRAASSGQTLTVKWTVETMHEAQWGNVTLQAATLVTNSNSGTVYQDLQYAYTADGNITTIADHTVAGGAGDQSLTYDSLNRLTEAEGPYGTGGATASITYSYDELGNLTANSQVGTYTYPTSGSSSVRPHAVTTAGSNSYSYDANGNMTAGAGRSFTYNLENKPLTITIGGQTTTFVYAGDGGRVKKVVGSTTTRYINKLYECESTSCARMIFAGSERVATLLPSGGVQYYHPDHLGSSSVITDGTGAKVEALTYFPYGATRTNSSPTTPVVDVPYKFTDKELDSSTSLYYYGARYYDPVLGRFISADKRITRLSNPQDFNRYTYVLNNPIFYTDPSGNTPQAALAIYGGFSGLAGGFLGGLPQGYTSAIVGGIVGGAVGALAGGSLQPYLSFELGTKSGLLVGGVMAAFTNWSSQFAANMVNQALFAPYQFSMMRAATQINLTPLAFTALGFGPTAGVALNLRGAVLEYSRSQHASMFFESVFLAYHGAILDAIGSALHIPGFDHSEDHVPQGNVTIKDVITIDDLSGNLSYYTPGTSSTTSTTDSASDGSGNSLLPDQHSGGDPYNNPDTGPGEGAPPSVPDPTDPSSDPVGPIGPGDPRCQWDGC